MISSWVHQRSILIENLEPHLSPNTDTSAISLFELYFNDTTIAHFIEATNAYAEEIKHTKKAMYRQFKYKQLTKTVLLLLGITRVRSYTKAWNSRNAQYILRLSTGVRSYTKGWNSRNAQYILRLNELMTRNRYEAIASFFHIVIPEEEASFGNHPLRKILLFQEYMKRKCCELYQPFQQLSVDERMVKS